MKKLFAIGGIGLLSSLAGQSWADTPFNLTVNNTNGQSDNAAPFPATNLDLRTLAGDQSVLTFTTPSRRRVRLLFNAECAVGGGPTNYAEINIYVDPAPIAAGNAGDILTSVSEGDNAFCAGNHTDGLDGSVSAVTQTYITVPAGTHSVRVEVLPVGAPWQIDDLSLVIDDE